MGAGGSSPACIRKAASNKGGSDLPRQAARRRIPRHAVWDSEYRDGAVACKICHKEHSTEYFVSVRHPRPQEVRHPHRENPTPIPHRWCMAAARIAHGRHAVGSFRNCVQPSHGLAFNGQYMRVVNDTVADGIGHGRIIKQLMPAGDVELRTEDSGCHLTPGFN